MFCVGVKRVKVVHKRRGEWSVLILDRLRHGTGRWVFGTGEGKETGRLEDNRRYGKFIAWAIGSL